MRIKYLVMISLLSFCASTYAIVVNNLYTDTVPVASRMAKFRHHVLPRALKRVLIKVSGSENVTDIPDIKEAIIHADHYVQAFSYSDNSNDKDKPLWLHITFLKNAVDDLLQQANQPIWHQNRPLLLIWFAEKSKSGLRLLNDDKQDPAVKLLRDEANSRGLPLMFPILDISDLQRIGASDVWAPFISVIQRASTRYTPDETVVIRMKTNDDNVEASFLLLTKDEQVSWQVSGKDLTAAIHAGIQGVVDTLMQRFVSVSVDQEIKKIDLMVTGLQDVSDYAKVMEYLKGLAAVSTVEIADVEANQVKFEVMLTGTISALKEGIQLTKMLKPLPSEDENDAEQITLKYRYEG